MTKHRKKMLYTLSLAALSMVAGITALIAGRSWGIPFVIIAIIMLLIFFGFRRMPPAEQSAQEKAERMANDERNMYLVYRACRITVLAMFYVLTAGFFLFTCVLEFTAVGIAFGALWLFLVIMYITVKLVLSKKM